MTRFLFFSAFNGNLKFILNFGLVLDFCLWPWLWPMASDLRSLGPISLEFIGLGPITSDPLDSDLLASGLLASGLSASGLLASGLLAPPCWPHPVGLGHVGLGPDRNLPGGLAPKNDLDMAVHLENGSNDINSENSP